MGLVRQLTRQLTFAKSSKVAPALQDLITRTVAKVKKNKDGKLDADDYKFASQRALTLLEANGKVAAGAFVAGFAYGFGARPVA